MGIVESAEQLSFLIVDPQMTAQAMRDSGYKDTTHALAELVDNAIESGANDIEVFGVSRRDDNTNRITLTELAVLDNGCGMDIDTLRGALRYGHGTRGERKGIGRYGLGLPNSSISQARRLDVWSWQSGVTNALHTRLWLDDILNGIKEIPAPNRHPIPDVYRKATKSRFGDSGTLVVWTELDRVRWKRASTTFRHMEPLLGRLYRRFLASPTERLHREDARGSEIGARRRIVLIPVEIATMAGVEQSVQVRDQDIVRVRPNDPLYLMSGTSCPEDFGPGRMFRELEGSPFIVNVRYHGKAHQVRVRAAYANPMARNPDHDDATWPEKYRNVQGGHTPWGKHAGDNMGVSVVRAHRELDLDESWTSGDDPRDRWWTVEVDFPTDLDAVFGVTNNKQSAMAFSRLARFEWKRYAMPGEKLSQARRRLEAEGDVMADLMELRKQVRCAIRVMKNKVMQSKRTRVPGSRSEIDKADDRSTSVIESKRKKGEKGESDRAGEHGSLKQQHEVNVKSLEKHGFDRDDATRIVDETFGAGKRVRCIHSSQDSPAFFSVEGLPNVLQVALNTNHPVYSHLYDMLTTKSSELSEHAARRRLERVSAGFRVLLYSWARFEEEQISGKRKQARWARYEWGEYADEFFGHRDNENDD